MTIPHHTFGTTTIAKVRDSRELRQVLAGSLPASETVVVKPNWVSVDPAEFTDADSLRMLFEALDSRLVVTESYCLPRALNIRKDGMSFDAGGRVGNWRWLLKGKGWTWLLEHPDWDWFRQGGHWEHLRQEEQAFLDRFGFTDLFEEFDVTYVNVTEEVWSGRSADPAAVRRLVEARFPPVHEVKLYNLVPQRLYDLRGSTFISLARLKMYASFTMKNLFGMIPDPLRPWWHGPQNCRIAQNVLDVNRVYHALFPMFGICEALRTVAVTHPEGAFEGIYSGRYNIVEGHGVVACGPDLAALDAILLHLSDPTKRGIAETINRGQINLAAQEFGPVDPQVLDEAKARVQNWISP